jgi:uncharacterized protein
MKCYRNKEILISPNITIANTSFSRLKGLIGKRDLSSSGGLLITPCNQIHTYFMRFSIDCLFLSKDGKVVYLIEEMQPWKASRVITSAYQVLELPAGTVRLANITLGTYITFKE